MPSKDKVAYFYDADVGGFYFGANHPMKPHRICMAHHLVLGYGLHHKMEIYRPRPATPLELVQFHSEDYIAFLATVSTDNQGVMSKQMQKHNLGNDCPVFDGLFDFCKIYSGAVRLNHGLSDICINWSGGLHHAKKSEASGFCYTNDLVLAILELLKYNPRVLYVDIDIHHGDGVEEAFYLSDRVMTVSFHKFGDNFFPGTGNYSDVGDKNGLNYAVNVPLADGIDDKSFLHLFKAIIAKVMEVFQPTAIVLQCGADSLSGDRLGSFNLTLDAHAECVKYMKKFKTPMLVTGGGGYTKHNVARCWANETAVLLDVGLKNDLPETIYHDYFGPTYKLKYEPTHFIENQNQKQHLKFIKERILENLSHLTHAPSVQMKDIPPDAYLKEYDDDMFPDLRSTQQELDKRIEHPAEFY